MKIRFLGTAAAEGIPAMFCHCDNCERARKAGGRNIRTRFQTLIDGKLNIDFPADAYMHELAYGLNYADIRYYLFTHVHEDHYYPLDFNYIYHGLGHVAPDHPGYDVYGSEDILPGLLNGLNYFFSNKRKSEYEETKAEIAKLDEKIDRLNFNLENEKVIYYLNLLLNI